MARRIKKHKKINYTDLILKDKKLLAFLIIIILLVLGRLFIPILSRKHDIEERRTTIDKELNRLNARIVVLSEEVKRLEEDKTYIEKIAREQLGLARKGEIVYNIVASEDEENKITITEKGD